ERVLRNRFELYQNYPNPLEAYTVIGFELPSAMEAKLTIYEITGRVLYEVQSKFEKGYHEVELSSEDIPEPGVLFYQLEAGGFSATRRMVMPGYLVCNRQRVIFVHPRYAHYSGW